MESYGADIVTVYAIFVGIQAGLGLECKMEEKKAEEGRELQERKNL